jgi:hypothetical protein
MKVRPGFVANSSSSSFLVALPKDLPLAPAALQQFLFGQQHEVGLYPGHKLSAAHAAAVLAEKLRPFDYQDPAELENLLAWEIAEMPNFLLNAPGYLPGESQSAYRARMDTVEKQATDAWWQMELMTLDVAHNNLFWIEFDSHQTDDAILEDAEVFRGLPYLFASLH